MLTLFCLRLALGLLACLLLLSPAQVNPRFYRTQFLAALGLALGALLLGWNLGTPWVRAILIANVLGTGLGSLSWSLEGAPAGRIAIVVTALGIMAALVLVQHEQVEQIQEPRSPSEFGWLLLADFISACLLGCAMTAMLMGHSYLIAPTMSLTPLLRLLTALFVITVLRMALSGVGLLLWSWSDDRNANLGDVAIWLPVRWVLGFLGPLVLGWMAWQSAKIRSTQSATGILYVVVVLCLLGELTGQLLLAETRYIC
jgi:hypothetical protein